ncbi:MAG: LysM peptidoglycan-binding domain-containing protein [Bacteroidetes bacterium]|nr:LysM peptidoglycan-binding domain-containing protein [Bacteroidota bacterium]
MKVKDFPSWPDLNYYPYNWLHPELNSFQFYNKFVLESLFQKMQNAQNKRVSILHIGDSHVQADIFTGEIRNLLQKAFGNGGRGMVFPYSTGRTHAAIDYSSEHTGKWLYAKNVEIAPELPLGISGISSRTYDSTASFTLRFRNTILPEYRKLRIYCNTSVESFDLKVKTPTEMAYVKVFDEDANPKGYVDVLLKNGDNTLSFYAQKTDSAQKYFEIYGISIENPEEKGLLYHSVGINGAGYYSLLKQNLFAEQLNYMQPDAVVLDIGANDFWKNGINKDAFIQNMDQMVDILRKYNPKIPIIFSCSQDIYRGGYSLADCAIFSDLLHEYCEKNDCAFYDWYWISGGRYSMKNWKMSGLANRDMVHLNGNGYRLKGQLITEAYYKTYEWFLNSDTFNSLVFDIDSLAHPPVDSSKLQSPAAPVYGWIYHKVRRNQTIWTIAQYYGCTAAQLRSWNRLKSNYLYLGQVLKVYTKLQSTIANVQENNPPPTVIKPAKPKAPAPVYHKVKGGETLSSIGRKYNTTAAEIKRLNRITGTTIRIGQVLRVK